MTNKLAALRAQIDNLNEARIALQMSGNLTDDMACELLEIVDALEDRYIALVNKANA
jgi:hypothetical protein